MKKYTIKDVARRANVGVGTVSRVLNNDPNVSAATRGHVQKIVAELNYSPSFIARQLNTKRSHTIGLIADKVATTPFAGNLIKGAQSLALEHGSWLVVIDTEGDSALQESAVEMLSERGVEGIIYAAMSHQSVMLPDAFNKLPTVLVDCYAEDRSLPSVVPDEVKGGYIATETLLNRGHRRIGFINIRIVPATKPAAVGRLEGYKQALAHYDIPFDEDLARRGTGRTDSGYECTLELMQLPEPPTAIFCATDRMAMGAYDALKELGLHIPDDVAVVGFDNQELIAEYLRPPLSTMALPHLEMGRWAVNYLFTHAKGNVSCSPMQERLECPFIERKSI